MQQRLPIAALALAALTLLAISVVTARRPATPLPSLDGYLDRWQAGHGYDPRAGSVWVRGWLTGVYRLARPLARTGVRPDVLTVWTVVLSLSVLAAAAEGGRWRMLAAWLLVFSGIGDSLDGAVAVMTQRATRWGYVLDSLVDRVNDVIYVLAVVVAGAPPWLGVVCAFSFFCLEYLRARAGNAGAGEVQAVTVGERPNRVAFCAAGLYCSGLFLASAAAIATGALAALTALTTVGLVQLTIAVRRHLR